MLSVRQGGINYHFLSLWYDSTWDWIQYCLPDHWRTLMPMSLYIYIYIYKCQCPYIYIYIYEARTGRIFLAIGEHSCRCPYIYIYIYIYECQCPYIYIYIYMKRGLAESDGGICIYDFTTPKHLQSVIHVICLHLRMQLRSIHIGASWAEKSLFDKLVKGQYATFGEQDKN